MTQVEQIYEEIERIKQTRCGPQTGRFYEGFHRALRMVTSFMDSLEPEEDFLISKSTIRKELQRLQREEKKKFEAEPSKYHAGMLDCIESIMSSLQFVVDKDSDELPKVHPCDVCKVGVKSTAEPENVNVREEIDRYIEYMYDGRYEKGSEIYNMLDKCARHFFNLGKTKK